MLSAFNSDKFKFWSFISMVLLVFVHGYNLDPRYMSPWTTPVDPLNFTSFTEYFLANGIFRFRIPMLFLISGYLYALYDQQPNNVRVKKRVRTLLLPYAIWSGFFLVVVYVCEWVSAFKDAIVASHVAQIDQTRMTLHEYHWYEFLIRWILFPLPFQLWFIRVLFFYNLCYPLIYKWVTGHRSKRIFFSVAVVLWLTTFPPILFDGEGLLFFSLGVWLQKTQFDIDTPKRWLNPLWWGIAFVSVSLLKTLLAFYGVSLLGNAIYPLLALLHKFVVASGLIAAWFGLNALVRWCMARKWFVWLSSFSFIIYALHAPLVTVAIDPFYQWLDFMPGYQLLTFILLPTAIVISAILLGVLLRKLVPRLYSVLTGGRGL